MQMNNNCGYNHTAGVLNMCSDRKSCVDKQEIMQHVHGVFLLRMD